MAEGPRLPAAEQWDNAPGQRIPQTYSTPRRKGHRTALARDMSDDPARAVEVEAVWGRPTLRKGEILRHQPSSSNSLQHLPIY